ncbi:putative ORFan, which is homologous to Tupanvirus deep ocean [Cotonvirus japonicus]|uniref:ORFan, which is homologous to Tupanvirus deep ocean n=1 Tax=Cotonvirus japonicus TaxID=2811091 RepID=A0ABM7NT61_9VIRU|nr:putative ORFan, which is homologous to Tupanvirus deep ocean [Cotonvirus japonicus]BCS83360.1 putative ORFan, which is homologous to Tupanvirus deep ocean [Cotonvirus japonicus]
MSANKIIIKYILISSYHFTQSTPGIQQIGIIFVKISIGIQLIKNTKTIPTIPTTSALKNPINKLYYILTFDIIFN